MATISQLSHAGELRVDECRRPLSDVTLDTGDAGMRRALPGLELRVHRRVARLSTEAWRFHRVEAAVAGQQNDDDVDSGESRDEECCPTDLRATKIDDGPFGRRRWIAPQLSPLSDMPTGMSSSPTANTAGMPMKTTRPAYGLENIPASIAITRVTNTTADAVVTTAPAIASGWRASAESHHEPRYFKLCM